MDAYQEARDVCRMMTAGGFPTMMAGGCVRDHLFGKEPSDYDLATTAKPKQMLRFFKQRQMRTVPVGLEHGTIAVITDLQQIEITTLRADEICDGRHAVVRFSDSFAEDAQRRDFTINALFEDADGKIHDYVGGQDDMRAKRLRFVGDAAARIGEDYLRIMRFFRFLGRLGWTEEVDQMAAVSANLEGLAQLSAERVHKEFALTLATKHIYKALDAMARSGTLAAIFPGVTTEHLAKTCKLLEKLDRSVLRWFAFLHWNVPWPSEKALTDFLNQMRFSRKDRRTVVMLHKLLNNLGQTYDPFVIVMNMVQDELCGANEVAEYLRLTSEVFALEIHTDVYDLLAGLNKLGKPPIEKEQLLEIEARERGRAVELVKIYWYSGRCHDTNEVNHILSRTEHYHKQWTAGSRQPFSRGGV